MLKADGLCYRDGKRPLIDQISLDFTLQNLYGLVGPNGSGKTTFLKCLAGIWTPFEGAVYWQGQPLLQQPRQQISQTISLVLPQMHVPFEFSVYDVVSMGLYPFRHRVSDDDAQKRVEKALTQVNLLHLKDRPIMHLSHGERQRVFIARALVTDAPVLALDEPTSNLDIRHQKGIWELLAMLAKEGKIVIVATHDITAARQYCHQMAVMDEGRCIAAGMPEEDFVDRTLANVFGVALSG